MDSESFTISTNRYCSTKRHAENCSVYFDQALLIVCSDGWFSVGRIERFFEEKACIYERNFNSLEMRWEALPEIELAKAKNEYCMFIIDGSVMFLA